MIRTKIVYEMDGIDYEFVGNQISTHNTGIVFRSHGDDKSAWIGELRYIHNEIYHCSERMMAIDGTFYYWTPVNKKVNKDSVLKDLIKEL